MNQTTPEIWKPIPGFEGRYVVSNRGRVKSLERLGSFRTVKGGTAVRRIPGRILRPGIASHGYPTVVLDRKSYCVGVLCLRAFVGERPEGFVCRHGDGNKTNNSLSNLEWATESRNMLDVKWHSQPNGLNRKLTTLDIPEIRKLLKNGETTDRIGDLFGVSGRTIRFIRSGERYADA